MTLYDNAYGSHISNQTGYRGFLNRLRIRKFSILIDPKPDEKILEIGCNGGGLLHALKAKGASVYGTDISKDVLEKIQTVPVFYMPATALDFPEESFDKICAFEVLEHVTEIRKAFENVVRVLKTGGKFYLSVPFEIIRGQAALYDAITVYHNPLYARKLHVHKLNPRKIKKIISGLPLTVITSKIIFIPSPSFFMVLEKNHH